jgi:hypothetical protein
MGRFAVKPLFRVTLYPFPLASRAAPRRDVARPTGRTVTGQQPFPTNVYTITSRGFRLLLEPGIYFT